MNVQARSMYIFFQENLSEAIMHFMQVVSEIDLKVEKSVSQDYKSAIQLLEQMKYLSNQNLNHGMLVGAAERFSKAVTVERRERLLLSYLGLMLCYHRLGEVNAIRQIQQIVSKLEFSRSFWEKHKGEITEGAMMFLGAAMSLAGGGSAGVGAALGGQTGSKESERMEYALKEREQIFYQLRDAMIGLQF